MRVKSDHAVNTSQNIYNYFKKGFEKLLLKKVWSVVNIKFMV